MLSYGDPFDEKELQEFLRDANVRGDGNVYYENFVDSMFVLAPELNELEVRLFYLRSIFLYHNYFIKDN